MEDALDGLRAVVFRLELATLRLSRLTGAVEALTGHDAQRWLDDPPLEVLTPEARAMLTDAMDRARQGDVDEALVFDIIDRRGVPRRLLQRHRMLRDPSGEPNAVQGLVVELPSSGARWEDASEADALLGAAARYRTVAENFPNGMVALFDRDLRYTVVNGEGLAAIGLSGSDLEGKRLRDVFPPDVYERDEPALLAALNGERTDALVAFGAQHFRVVTLPVKNAAGEVIQGMVMSQNVTALKESELRLEKAIERLTMVAETGGIGLWDMDLASGRIEWSARQFEMYGMTPDELAGLDSVMARVHPDDRATVRAETEEALRGVNVRGIEYRVVRSDGTIRHLSSSAVAERNEDGKPTRLLGMSLDVTARKEREAERARVEARTLQARRLEALGELTGGVAHDFNNLLQVIVGETEEARDLVGDEHPSSESLNDVMAAAERAARLVEQLLAFGRRRMLQPRSVDLRATLDALFGMLGTLLGDHVRLSLGSLAGAHLVHADAGSLEQVVMNLCINARDAMPRGGTIDVATRPVAFDEEQAAEHGLAAGRYIELTVKDDGEGMTDETLARAFDPFFTTKEVGKGTGLGLATVYGIVRQHDGAIRAESEVGRGTVFTLYWPESESQPSTGGQAPSARPPAVRRDLVLVAEDNELVRRSTVQRLQRAGYEVLAVQDGAEAVAAVDARGDSIALALLDVQMPNMTGTEAYERIAEMLPSLPVVFVSGFTDAPELATATAETPPLLRKPFTKTELLDVVAEALRKPG